jgi:hypothetical protein
MASAPFIVFAPWFERLWIASSGVAPKHDAMLATKANKEARVQPSLLAEDFSSSRSLSPRLDGRLDFLHMRFRVDDRIRQPSAVHSLLMRMEFAHFPNDGPKIDFSHGIEALLSAHGRASATPIGKARIALRPCA